MATWHVSFRLEPAALPLPVDFREQLGRLLPRGRTWLAEHEAWGDDDESHRIELTYGCGGSIELYCGIDCHSLEPTWLEQFLTFVRYTGRQLRTADGRVIEPNLGELTLAIRGSPGWRYVEDPTAYLRRVRLGSYEDA